VEVHEKTAPATEKVPDAGQLPAWEVTELPAPIPFGWKNVLKAIGPGIIMLGGSIGTGEWLLGPGLTARFSGQLLWIASLAIILQSFLNTECIRYALYTGEPVFTGYLRSKPGPRFWSGVYLLCDAGMFLPTFVANIAALLLAAFLGFGNTPGPEHRFVVMWIGLGILALCFTLMLFGGKVYNVLQGSMTIMILYIMGFLIFVDVFLVPWSTWAILLRGFLWPFNDQWGLAIPEGLKLTDWALIAGFAAYAGAGGLSNATFSNYARDKGWGMGAKVGAIPSAVGGIQIELSPLGKVFPVTQEALNRWKQWWRYVKFDQYVVWVFGCFLGMILPAALTLQFVPPMEEIKGMEVASMQARGIAAQFPAHQGLFWSLTLFCGFLILWSTQIQVLDHVPRRWTDILWNGSAKARDASGNDIKRIYYTIAGAYALMNALMLVGVTLIGGTPFTILLVQSVTAGMAMVVSSFHTLHVNRRFLPKPLRPSRFREAGLIVCGLFYFVMSGLAIYGQVEGYLEKSRAAKAPPAVHQALR
jgi:hypothetical protein